MYRSQPNGSVCIAHKEYIGDVTGSTNFLLREYQLNPGLQGTVPWLSQMADTYEEYRWKNLAFMFKSTSSEFVLQSGGGSNGALGTVSMATNYNATIKPSFTNKKEMENYQFASSAPPTRNQVHQIECKGPGTPLKTMYLRQTVPQPNTDIRLYDIGTFALATQGMAEAADGATIGELWVAYEVEFYKPKYRPNGAKGDHFNLVTGKNLINSGPDLPFGTVPLIDRTHPPIGPSNPDNGVFFSDSYIRNDVGANTSELYLPRKVGTWYKITLLVSTMVPTTILRGDGFPPNFILTPSSATLVPNTFKNWNTNGAFSIPYNDAPTHAGERSDSGQWVAMGIYVVEPHDANNLPRIHFQWQGGPDEPDIWGMDLIVEEVNPDLYSDPNSR